MLRVEGQGPLALNPLLHGTRPRVTERDRAWAICQNRGRAAGSKQQSNGNDTNNLSHGSLLHSNLELRRG